MWRIFLFLMLFFTCTAYACLSQDSLFITKTDSPTVSIKKDPKLDLLIKKQIQINEETSRNARRLEKGYRLLIISTTLRDEALAAKTKVYTAFPELKAYLFHQSPYYKVKVGNFKERKEADSYQRRLELLFPKGVFVINDVIEVKLKLPGEEETPDQE